MAEDNLPVSDPRSPEYPANRAKRAESSEDRDVKRVCVKAGTDAERRLRVPFQAGDAIPDSYWFSAELDRTLRYDLQYFGCVEVE